MKAAKLLQIGAELLSLMSTFDLKVSDFHHLELYSEYIKARQNNEKYSYIIASLAERYVYIKVYDTFYPTTHTSDTDTLSASDLLPDLSDDQGIQGWPNCTRLFRDDSIVTQQTLNKDNI